MLDQSLSDTLTYHHSMLQDETRTSSFLRAILGTVKPGDIVLDIGAGTGILALFACLAGARHVYAIERDPIIELARQISRDNGFSERISFFQDWSTNVELPEPADVLVTETIGNAGFDEGILGWVHDAKQRLLKPEARIIPRSVELITAPVKNPTDFNLVSDWRKDLYGFDFSSARTIMAKQLIWTRLSEKALLGKPVTVSKVCLDQFNNSNVRAEVVLEITKHGWMHGLVIWFRTELMPGLNLSNKPQNSVPSWNQGFLPLLRPLEVDPGDCVQAVIEIDANGANWLWQVDSNKQSSISTQQQLVHSEKLDVNH